MQVNLYNKSEWLYRIKPMILRVCATLLTKFGLTVKEHSSFRKNVISAQVLIFLQMLEGIGGT